MIEDRSGEIFRNRPEGKATCVTLQQCPKCGAYSRDAFLCCVKPIALLPPAQPLLMPASPLEHNTLPDEMWGHLLGGEG